MLKIAYSFFLGILLAVFVGVGIAAFYTQPSSPKFPEELNMINKEPTTEQQQMQKAFDTKQQAWEEKMKPYNRNVSLIALVAAVTFVAIGLIFEERIKVLADGLVLGGVFTLLYSIGRGFAAQNAKYSFMIVSIGLAIALILGYLRFIKPESHTPAKKA